MTKRGEAWKSGIGILLLIAPLAAGQALSGPRERRGETPDKAAGEAGRFAGMTWTVPRGLVARDIYATCPLRCVLYEGPNPDERNGVGWPLLMVLEPIPGTAEHAIETWRAARERAWDEPPRTMTKPAPLATVAGGRLMAAVYAEGDRAREHSTGVLVCAFERDGVSVPIILWGHHGADLKLRTAALTEIVRTLKFDAAALKQTAAASASAHDTLEREMWAAIAHGERPRLFLGTKVEMQFQALSGLMAMVPQDALAVFLPGAVFSDKLPSSLVEPKLDEIAGDKPPRRWKKAAGVYTVTAPDGTTERYTERANGSLERRKAMAGGKSDFEVELYPVRPLRPAELAGHYVYSHSFAAGLGGAVLATGGVERALDLGADGRYRLTGGILTNATGSPNVSRKSIAETGQWHFDPQSFMFTLQPDAGAPIAYPAFVRPAALSSPPKESEWEIFGQTWKR